MRRVRVEPQREDLSERPGESWGEWWSRRNDSPVWLMEEAARLETRADRVEREWTRIGRADPEFVRMLRGRAGGLRRRAQEVSAGG